MSSKDRMNPKHPRNGGPTRQSSRAGTSPSSEARGAGRQTQHGGWQFAKRLYGVVFLVVIIYVGINLLRA